MLSTVHTFSNLSSRREQGTLTLLLYSLRGRQDGHSPGAHPSKENVIPHSSQGTLPGKSLSGSSRVTYSSLNQSLQAQQWSRVTDQTWVRYPSVPHTQEGCGKKQGERVLGRKTINVCNNINHVYKYWWGHLYLWHFQLIGPINHFYLSQFKLSILFVVRKNTDSFTYFLYFSTIM